MATFPDCNTTEVSCVPLVYACSGASDVGEITDRVARRLHAGKIARMQCLASIGARTVRRDILAKAPVILAIDGCPKECVSKLLELAGLKNVRQVRLADIGLVKDASPADEAAIAHATDHCRRILTAPRPAAPGTAA